jgi:hypothetical protein
MKEITGKEFKEFYNDKLEWRDGMYVDDFTYLVRNGEITLLDSEIEVDDITDDALVLFTGGVCLDEYNLNYEEDIIKKFKKWKAKQNLINLFIKVPKDQIEEIKEYLKSKKIKFQ